MILIKNKMLILAVILFFSLALFPSAVFAEGPVTFTVTFDGEFIVGEEVSMIIRINNASGTDGGQFDLSFDGDILEPLDFKPGDFVPEMTGTDINLISANLELDDGKLRVLWAIGEGSAKDTGILGTILFEILEEGETTPVFSGLKVTDPDAVDMVAEVTVPTVSTITVIDVATAKAKAIKAAEDAIAALKEPVTLADGEAIKDARALVVKAKERWGAVDSDFSNLKKLEDAEKHYAKLFAIFTADNAIAALPSVEKLTLKDEDAVKAARALVNAAKSQHGAVDTDFENLDTLRAAENKIAELKGLKPTPPTGGMLLIQVAGVFFLLAGMLIYNRSRQLSAWKLTKGL